MSYQALHLAALFKSQDHTLKEHWIHLSQCFSKRWFEAFTKKTRW